MNTKVDLIDRSTIAIDFDSSLGHEVVLVEGDKHDEYISVAQSDLLLNPSLKRCDYTELRQAIDRYNLDGHFLTIELIDDEQI